MEFYQICRFGEKLTGKKAEENVNAVKFYDVWRFSFDHSLDIIDENEKQKKVTKNHVVINDTLKELLKWVNDTM